MLYIHTYLQVNVCVVCVHICVQVRMCVVCIYLCAGECVFCVSCMCAHTRVHVNCVLCVYTSVQVDIYVVYVVCVYIHNYM